MCLSLPMACGLRVRACVCAHIPSFPSPSILGVFHSLLSAIGFQSSFFFTADVSPPIRSTLPLLTFEVSVQAWDWLWYPMLWFHRRNSGAHGAENSIQISALAGVEPGTLGIQRPRMLPLDDRAHLLIYIYIYIYNGGGYLSVGPTVFCGPRNFEPSRGIWVFTAEFGPRNWATEFVFSPRNLTFFIRTTIFSQKMTSK